MSGEKQQQGAVEKQLLVVSLKPVWRYGSTEDAGRASLVTSGPVTRGYIPSDEVTSHRKSGFKETSRSCFSIDLPSGVLIGGWVGTSKLCAPSRA